MRRIVVGPKAPIAMLALLALATGLLALSESDLSLHDHRAHEHPEARIKLADVQATRASEVFDRLGGYQQGPAVAHRGSAQRLLPKVRGELFDTGVLAAEPTLGIDSRGAVYFKGLIDGSATVEWPVVASFDDGKTWEDVSSTVGDTRVHSTGNDPFLFVDKTTDRVFDNDFEPGCALLSVNDDVREQEWSHSGICGLTDHQNMFAGPPRTSDTAGYPNVVYYCAIDGGALAAYGTLTSCLKSTDGGVAWVKTGEPAFAYDPDGGDGMFGVPGHCGGATGHGFADSKGIVYMPRGYCGQPWLAISKDEGASWKRVQVARNGFPAEQNGGLHEHESGVAVDKAGNIFYFYMARDRLPYLVVSRDGGKSWSKPQRVGPPALKEAALPTIDVGSNGRIALAYVGSENAPGGKAPDGQGPEYDQKVSWNGYITVTTDALDRKPRFITAMVNDPKDPLVAGSCGIVRCQQVFDFIDVVIAPDGSPWAAFVDACDRQHICTSLGKGVVGHLSGGPNLGGW